MANERMFKVSLTVLQVMMDVFPQKHLEFMFAGLLDPADIVEMVIFDVIKKSIIRLKRSILCDTSLKNMVLQNKIRLCAIAGFNPMYRNIVRESMTGE